MPKWDYNTTEGKESLQLQRQALLASLKATSRKLTNMAKIYDVRQERDGSPAAYLERLMTAFKQFFLYDPESEEAQQTVIVAYVNEAAPDIKRKLHLLERLGEKRLRDLVAVAEKVYNKKETEEESQ